MGRTPCCSKEQGLNKGAWTAMEDKILIDYIKTYGQGRWRNIPKKAGLNRCGKSCRLRWLNYLRPGIKRGNISEDEEELIVRLHKLLGNRWALIAGRLPGRTDNEIKNYWNTIIGKKITNQQLIYAPSPVRISTHNEPHNQSKPKDPTIKRSSSSPAELQPLPDPQAITEPEDLKNYQNVNATLTPEVTSAEEPISPTNIVEENSSTNFLGLDNFMMDFDIDQDFISDILNTTDLSQLVATDHYHQACDYQPIASFVGTDQSDWLLQDK